MQVEQLISGARDAVSVKRVYGEPYEHDGLTVIPAATVRGGGGGGTGEAEGGESSGGGAGFGLTARPAGAWIIEDGHVNWKPAVDANRVILGGQAVAVAAIVVVGRILLARSRRRQRLRMKMRRPDLQRVPLHLPGRAG